MFYGVVGCGKSNPDLVRVRGTITYQGKPLTTGTVTFMPKDANRNLIRPAMSGIGVDGSYELKALPNQAGALIGEYLVGVWCCTGSEREGNLKYFVPQKFSDPYSSGLKATIPETSGEPVRLNFALVD
jgi:hypothetical protein